MKKPRKKSRTTCFHLLLGNGKLTVPMRCKCCSHNLSRLLFPPQGARRHTASLHMTTQPVRACAMLRLPESRVWACATGHCFTNIHSHISALSQPKMTQILLPTRQRRRAHHQLLPEASHFINTNFSLNSYCSNQIIDILKSPFL